MEEIPLGLPVFLLDADFAHKNFDSALDVSEIFAARLEQLNHRHHVFHRQVGLIGNVVDFKDKTSFLLVAAFHKQN